MPGPRYWQVAAGDLGRDYSRLFLDHGLAFVGGDKHVARLLGLAARDRLLLKRGTGTVLAVGEVVERDGRRHGDARKDGDPARQWLRDFDGWDLGGWCNVRWHEVPPADQQPPVAGLVRGTFKRVMTRELQQRIARWLRELPARGSREPEPSRVVSVSDEALLNHLVSCGLRVGAAEELTRQLKRVRLLADYYFNKTDKHYVKEHETRSFLVLPLLLAFGWAEQQLKIEYACPGGSVDIACFRHPFTSPVAGQVVMLIETKSLSQGLDLAFDQAQRYAKHFPTCSVLLVTNGLCFKACRRMNGGAFSEEPTACLNLRTPTDRYPLDPARVAGALDAVELLLPDVAARRSLSGKNDVNAAA